MYKIYNDDCLKIMPQLIDEGVKVDLILADIPYGTTHCNWDSTITLKPMWDSIKRISQKNTPTLLFSDEPFSSKLRMSNIKEYKYDWIWIKEGPSNIFNAKIRPMKYTENINVFYKQQCKFYPERIKIPRISRRVEQHQKNEYIHTTEANSIITGKPKSQKIIRNFSKNDANWKNPSNCLFFSRVKANSHENVNHPTQKPVKLLEYLIKAYTDEGDIVLDFTMGSGSTGVASMNLNRDFIGIELDTKYYDIAEKRIKEARKDKQAKLI